MTLPCFKGPKKELKAALRRAGVMGRYKRRPDELAGIRLVTPEGAILNWWESTGRAQVQGSSRKALRQRFRAAIALIEEDRRRTWGLYRT